MKAIVFDMDGVIFDSETLVISCWKQVALKYGLVGIREVCIKCLGTNASRTKEIFKETYGRDVPYDTYKKEASQLFHKAAEEGKLAKKPGIEELLTYLKEETYKIGLASSTREEIVREELSSAGLLSYFDAVVCGDMVKRSKPEPDIYLEACRRLGAKPEDAFAIEDSYNGILAAWRAGMKPAMVPDLLEPTQQMRELCCFIGDSLYEVKKFLENLKDG